MPLSPIGTVVEGKCIIKAMDRTLAFKGVLDVPHPGKYLDPFFKELHANALENAVKMIIVDLRLLKYVNSSSIRSMVTWLLSIKSMPVGKAYTLYFVVVKKRSWQTVMIDTFRMLLPNNIKVKEV
jgi:hypothetical protein